MESLLWELTQTAFGRNLVVEINLSQMGLRQTISIDLYSNCDTLP